MDRYVFVGVFAILTTLGCSQPGESGAPAASNTPNQTGESQPSDLGETPDKAVAQFLEAVRSGNDDTAAALLTPLAQQKTAEEGLAVAPPGRPTAKFTVGKFEFVTANKDGAHVLSNWSDVDENGQVRSDEIIWVLRKEAAGWRIVGSVMKVFPDKDPLVLNYEDPQDMKRKLQMVYEEETKTENPQPVSNGQPQAKVPGNTPAAVR